MINAIEAALIRSIEDERNEQSRVSRVEGRKNFIESGKKTCFSRSSDEADKRCEIG